MDALPYDGRIDMVVAIQGMFDDVEPEKTETCILLMQREFWPAEKGPTGYPLLCRHRETCSGCDSHEAD